MGGFWRCRVSGVPDAFEKFEQEGRRCGEPESPCVDRSSLNNHSCLGLGAYFSEGIPNLRRIQCFESVLLLVYWFAGEFDRK